MDAETAKEMNKSGGGPPADRTGDRLAVSKSVGYIAKIPNSRMGTRGIRKYNEGTRTKKDGKSELFGFLPDLVHLG